MVKQSQVACFQCFVERLCLGYIGFAGQGAAGRVVMDKDYCRGLFVESLPDDGPVVYDGAVQTSATDHLSTGHPVGIVQEQDPALFMIKVSQQRLHDFEYFLWGRQ